MQFFQPIDTCAKCGLCDEARHPRMTTEIDPSRDILIVSCYPGMYDDLRGKPFIGEEADYVEKELAKFHIRMRQDCNMVYAVACRPNKPSTVAKKYVRYCRQHVMDAIEQAKPKLILLLGTTAIDSVITPRWGTDLGGSERWRGELIPDQNYKALIAPLYDYKTIVSHKTPELLERVFTDDLRRALALGTGYVHRERDDHSKIDIVSEEEAVDVLESLEKGVPVSFDYETTGLKPYAVGHYIYSCALCWDTDFAVAFKVGMHNELRSAIGKFCADPEIPKVAANIKFEQMWTNEILGYGVGPWEWDVMQVAHILNNFPGKSSVKYQAYTRLGVGNYAVDIKKFLEAKTSNGFNTIEEAPLEDLLMYNGFDALYEHEIYELQKKEIEG